jgi:malate dehydrogenase
MLPLKDYTSVSGLPVSNLLSDEAFQRAVSSTITAGDDILNMAGRANAYYGPAAAICDLAQSMTLNSKRIFSVSLMLDGQYGLSGACMSLPAVIGSEGIHRVLEPKLSEAEVERLKKAISDQD